MKNTFILVLLCIVASFVALLALVSLISGSWLLSTFLLAFGAFLISRIYKLIKTQPKQLAVKTPQTKTPDPYLANAEKEAEKILANAQKSYDQKMSDANKESAEKRKKAKEYADRLKAQADATFAAAQDHYNTAVKDAENKAREIAGDAYEALKRADELSSIARAMQNSIDGYGNEYLIPAYSLLDDLADEFDFAEAGERLKQARTTSRTMCKRGMAADCDYVEIKRRETAIRFVLDAFNGKVDSILSKTKHNNFGKLKQQIVDAFHIVNSEGAAFRNARIKSEYLDFRLEELHWGVVAQELKAKAKEEQRQIKEQIREETKAQREFERAIKEAAKEQDMLRKAMEKAQAEIARATDEQRAKYEAELAGLQLKLAEAEEKNQRALSMAQQTRQGHVYVISNIGSFGENVYKIGMARRLEPMDRVKELGDASVPFEFDVHAMITHHDAPTLEHELHRIFLRQQVNKVNPRKEFFKADLVDIKKVVEEMGIKARWTVAAEAAQYYETMELEREMASDENKEREWLESQRKYEAREFLAAEEEEEEETMAMSA